MNKARMRIAKTPVLGPVLLTFYRARIAWAYYRGPLFRLVKWLFRSRELTNFTYDLDETNQRYLAAMIADVTGREFAAVTAYIEELEADRELRAHIENATKSSDLAFMADDQVRYGRRVGWYALARLLKPKVIIETGVDKGLGSCLLTAALMKNKQEGHDGRYYGTDINPRAGYMLSGEYADHGSILYGDSIDSLKRFDGVIDLFINDSDHSADYEAEEYRAIAGKLSAEAVILGDNSHCTDKLLEFSLETNREFIFIHEKPRDHWYPGAGIGLSFRRSDEAK